MLSPPYCSHLRHCNVSYEKSKPRVFQPQIARMSRIDSCQHRSCCRICRASVSLPEFIASRITQTVAAVFRVAHASRVLMPLRLGHSASRRNCLCGKVLDDEPSSVRAELALTRDACATRTK